MNLIFGCLSLAFFVCLFFVWLGLSFLAWHSEHLRDNYQVFKVLYSGGDFAGGVLTVVVGAIVTIGAFMNCVVLTAVGVGVAFVILSAIALYNLACFAAAYIDKRGSND